MGQRAKEVHDRRTARQSIPARILTARASVPGIASVSAAVSGPRPATYSGTDHKPAAVSTVPIRNRAFVTAHAVAALWIRWS